MTSGNLDSMRGLKVFKNKMCPYCSHRYPSGSSKRNKQTSSFFWTTNPDGYRFKCLRCGESKTLHQYLVDNQSSELVGQYQWDRFRHGCTGKDQNCKNPDPDLMKAYKSWAFSSVDKPPAFEERREFYRQQQQRQKELNWIQGQDAHIPIARAIEGPPGCLWVSAPEMSSCLGVVQR